MVPLFYSSNQAVYQLQFIFINAASAHPSVWEILIAQVIASSFTMRKSFE